VYSLVSSAVLAADLARHPYGSRVADTLDRVLALTPREAAALGSPADEALRQRVVATCSSRRVGTALGEVAELVPGREPAEGELAGLATRLEDALLGSLEDLHAMVLREDPVAGLPAYAQQVVCDALTASWAGPEAALRDVRALLAPWEAAVDPVPPALPERPWTAGVRALHEEVPRRAVRQWETSVRSRRALPGQQWSEAMHLSCDAAWRDGRLHDVARAQLAAARALSLTHPGVPQGAAAMVVTAAVQALATQDLLADSVVRVLLGAWEAGASAR
jgi:hypothetical protein